MKRIAIFSAVSALIFIWMIYACGAKRQIQIDVKNLKPTYLRCEFMVDPLGIDEIAPRLSWVIESDDRGQKQTAYRILVASSKELLGANKADLWDSGCVKSGQSVHVPYSGRPPQSRMRCYWKVRIWDKDGKTSFCQSQLGGRWACYSPGTGKPNGLVFGKYSRLRVKI